MKIITPTVIGDAQFVSSTIAENDYAEWNSGTAYTIGNRVMIAATHKTYEALTANTNKPPATNPADWLDLGYTNRWRMFDQKVGTVTSATTSLTTTLAPGLVNALALINVTASSVRVKVTDPTDGVVYDKTVGMYDPLAVTDWYAYFFDPVRTKTTLVLLDLPAYGTASVEITLSSAAGAPVSVGSCVIGKSREYARSVRAGASVGIMDYSRKEKDAFGNFMVTARAFAKRARWSFLLDSADVDALQAQLASLRATPAVYIGGGNFDSTTLYGFFRDFDTVIAYPKHSECSIEIEGLV